MDKSTVKINENYGDLGENPAEIQQPFPGLWT